MPRSHPDLQRVLCLRLASPYLILFVFVRLDDGVYLVVEEVVEYSISCTHDNVAALKTDLVLVCIVWLVLAQILSAPLQDVS